MATRNHLKREEIGKNSPHIYNRIRTTIETAYHRNNVIRIHSLEEAYELAKNARGTIVSDLPVYRPKDLGLPEDAKVLLFNDGAITGRQAQARRIINNDNREDFARTLREAIFNGKDVTFYHATVMIGLHEDFSVKAHLLIPEGYENTMYSWLLNFQIIDETWQPVYDGSRLFDEGDILLYSDPDYLVDGFDSGLALFDRDHNCAALFGMRYFGEHKKGTLTMAWSLAERQNFTACHGGIKEIRRQGKKPYTMSVFGLSGSGKSTITHAKHNGKYDIEVLHDDAFIIENDELYTVSLEPSYFDKVQDYPTNSSENRFLLTVQNVGATRDENDLIVPVTEDIRNGNGRAVKSKFWTPARAYKFNHPVNSIFWIMKDDTLPPLIKINSPALASTMGATLATKRSSAEEGADPNKLAFVPYANPFRLYPLVKDYENFKHLFENHDVDCYIINTGFFLDKKIKPQDTLGAIESIIDDNVSFKAFLGSKHLSYSPIDGFELKTDANYLENFKKRMEQRLAFIGELKGEDILPKEATQAVNDVIKDVEGV